jgi:AraC-like DNA-binding protein
MDKTTVTNAEIEYPGIEVHRMPIGRQRIHVEYGLWICKFNRHNVAPPPESKEYPRYFEHYAISHLIEGRGFYWEPGKPDIPMLAGDAVIVCPGHVHHYGGDAIHYVEDSICFAGPVAERLQQCGVLSNGVVHVGSARRLLPIIEQALIPSVHAQVKANMALQNLLVELYLGRERREQSEAYRYIRELTEQLRDTPDAPWTVTRMAEYCNLSPSRFRVVFRAVTGIAPKTYLDRFRIQQAAEALVQGDESIAAIADRCGFPDAYHFSRRFKELTGYAPRDYRREMRLFRR